jgi:hypothetical protein
MDWTWMGNFGLFSIVDADAPGVNIVVKFHHLFSSGGLQYSMADAAEERAVESLIRSAKRDFKLRTEDLNCRGEP